MLFNKLVELYTDIHAYSGSHMDAFLHFGLTTRGWDMYHDFAHQVRVCGGISELDKDMWELPYFVIRGGSSSITLVDEASINKFFYGK